jgi:hypothetical protein
LFAPGWLRLALVAWLVVSLAALASYAYAGWFSRYASDDFCTAGVVRQEGFLAAQAYWYAAWSGRFTFTALVSALELLGVAVVQVLPGLTIGLWLAAGTWALWPVARAGDWPVPRLAAPALAALVVVATVAAAPDRGQSVYWQTGVLTYVLPLVAYTWLAGWGVRRFGWGRASWPVSWQLILAVGLVLFLLGGLSETTLTLQTGVLAVGLVMTLAQAGRARPSGLVWLLAAGLVGSLTAGAVMTLAPGNAIRALREHDAGASLTTIPLAVRASLMRLPWFLRRFEAEFRPLILVVALLPAAVGFLTTRARSALESARVGRRLGGLALVGLGGTGLILVSFFPGYWIQGFDPSARVQIVAQWLLVLTVSGLGYVAGELVGSTVMLPALAWRLAGPVSLALLLAACVVPLTAIRETLAEAAAEQGQAAAWDRNDQLLRAAQRAGTLEAVVPALPKRWGWDYFGPRLDDFPNGCGARYYDVPGVRTV